MSNLKDKGILTDADIEQIESTATEQFAEDVQTIKQRTPANDSPPGTRVS